MNEMNYYYKKFLEDLKTNNQTKFVLKNYGQFSEQDFDPEQLSKGVKVEMEHTNDPVVAKQIAMDHLKESPLYYQYLDKMEKEMKGLSERFKEYITHEGSKWVVHAESGKVLGTHDTEEKAKKQLQAIEISKHKGG